jgi:hypothetical protein
MDKQVKARVFFWSGFVLISLLYATYYVFFLYDIAQRMPLRGRHIIKFLFVALVYFTGVVCLRKPAAGWVRRTWHIIYLLTLALLLLLGLYDWAIARTPLGVREIADDLLEFLVSPILFVVMWILSRKIGEMKTGEKSV